MEWYPCSYSGGDWDSLLDTHGVTPDPQTFPADRGLPFAGTTPSNESFTDIYNFSKSHKSGFYTTLIADNWYNVLNLRHRNGYGDGINYSMALYCRLNNNGGDLCWMREANGVKETSRILLDTNNYSSKIGRINNRLTLDRGSYVGAYTGTAGSTGYVNFARIKIIDSYPNYPCVFVLGGRGRPMPMIVGVNFQSVNTNDPALAGFYKMFVDSYEVYIYKTATSQWDLYAPKNEAWGRIDILDLWYSTDHFSISFPNAHVATLNSAWAKATMYGEIDTCSRVRDAANKNPITFSYGTSGLPIATTQWIAAWNGYQLRAIDRNAFIQAKSLNGFYGMCFGNYQDDGWIRTTQQGILPYQSGTYASPHSAIGTDNWWFTKAYISNINTADIEPPKISGSNYNGHIGSLSNKYENIFTHRIKSIERIIFTGSPWISMAGVGPNLFFCSNLGESDNPTESISSMCILCPPANDKLYPQIYPFKDGYGRVGSNTNRWNQFYAVNGTIQTSDRNEKKEVSYIGKNSDYDTWMDDETLKSFIRGLLPVIYKRINGESGRPHHGFIAQDIEKLLQKLGITDHAAFIRSPKTETIEIEEEAEETYTDEMDGQVKTRTVIQKREEQREIPGEYIYGLRYEEFTADIVRFVQLQDEKIEEQERKIKSLERRLSALENMLNASTG